MAMSSKLIYRLFCQINRQRAREDEHAANSSNLATLQLCEVLRKGFKLKIILIPPPLHEDSDFLVTLTPRLETKTSQKKNLATLEKRVFRFSKVAKFLLWKAFVSRRGVSVARKPESRLREAGEEL